MSPFPHGEYKRFLILFVNLMMFQVPTSPRKDENFDEDMIDLASLEIEAQLCMLPFLRIASLVRHYLFQHPLPIIEETLGNIGHFLQ
jgi:hypothetical protein